MPLRVFQEMIKLGASIKKRKRQRLSTKISAFQDLHVICGMNLVPREGNDPPHGEGTD